MGVAFTTPVEHWHCRPKEKILVYHR